VFTRLCKRSHLEKHTVLFITAPNKGINTDAVNGAGYASVLLSDWSSEIVKMCVYLGFGSKCLATKYGNIQSLL
jgi:hypothetical protein